MQAIVLAAGMGKGLNDLTKDNTKCMVEINGVKLIDRMLHQLDERGLSRIVIVCGYQRDKLKEFINKIDVRTHIEFIDNTSYETTNNIYSLYLVKSYLASEESIILESDIIFEDSVLDMVFENTGDNIAVIDNYKCWMTGMGVALNDKNEIISFVKESEIDYSHISSCFKTVGIYRFQPAFIKEYYVPFLEAYINTFGKTARYEQVLRILAMTDENHIFAKNISGRNWYEINNIQDIDLASTLFANDDEFVAAKMLGRWGGYWRYPDYLDYFYLVTPYYPPGTMINEIKASFYDLLTQYPSSMKVNSLLAAKEFSVCIDNIVIGNGASELIKALMQKIDGKTGFIRPTFEEFYNRYEEDKAICMDVSNEDFSYNAEDVIEFLKTSKVDNIVIVNPDNPSGNYIKKKDLLRVAKWCKKNGVRLIVDESFVDFVEEVDSSMIKQDIIDQYPNLYVIKSISKSYGVPGIRLGVLSSGDIELIGEIKKDVAIWNINSFAEFYMQIAGKYREDYFQALKLFRIERRRFQNELKKVKGIRVIPSQANYIMLELINGINADDFKVRMLIDRKIFIKSLSKKIKSKRQYIRIAIRNREDNDKFLESLKEEFEVMRNRHNEA